MTHIPFQKKEVVLTRNRRNKKAGTFPNLLGYMVEHRGLEPLTFGLQSRRSTS